MAKTTHFAVFLYGVKDLSTWKLENTFSSHLATTPPLNKPTNRLASLLIFLFEHFAFVARFGLLLSVFGSKKVLAIMWASTYTLFFITPTRKTRGASQTQRIQAAYPAHTHTHTHRKARQDRVVQLTSKPQLLTADLGWREQLELLPRNGYSLDQQHFFESIYPSIQFFFKRDEVARNHRLAGFVRDVPITRHCDSSATFCCTLCAWDFSECACHNLAFAATPHSAATCGRKCYVYMVFWSHCPRRDKQNRKKIKQKIKF